MVIANSAAASAAGRRPDVRSAATLDAIAGPVTVRCSLVRTRQCGVLRLTGLVAATPMAAALSCCGSGDSTVAKTPEPTMAHTEARPTAAPRTPGPQTAAPANT